MKRGTKHDGQIARLVTLGGLLGIKTSTLLPRLAPFSSHEKLLVTVPHTFDAMTVTARLDRAAASPLCPWLDALPGDELELAIDATSITAWSDEAALPADPPAPIGQHADILDALGFDGAAWTYRFHGTIELLDELAARVGATDAQRRIAADLDRSFDRANRVSASARDGALDPHVSIAWDKVEWGMLQSMLKGFYPRGNGVAMVARLSRAEDADHATVELVLGPTDPPAVRFSFDV